MRLFKTKVEKLATKRAKDRRNANTPRSKARRAEWRSRNRDYMRERSNAYYERTREHQLWVSRLRDMLMRIRRYEIDNGRIPYDG